MGEDVTLEKDADRRRATRPAETGAMTVDGRFLKRTAIIFGFAVLAYALYQIAYVVLLVFAAILLAIVVRAFTSQFERIPKLGSTGAFAVGLIVLAAIVAGFGWLFWSTLSGQVVNVLTNLPQAIESLGERFGISNPVQRLEAQVQESAGSGGVGRVVSLGSSIFSGLLDVLIVTVAAIYLAYDPRLYRRGFVKLFPVTSQERVDEALLVTGSALRLWFLGQLVSMTLVGLLTGLGFWWIGLPAPAALGLIAGATNFIPFIGPFIGSIPAAVFAFNMGLNPILWTVAVVTVVQQLEGNVFLPLIQRKAVRLPPALALFAIVMLGLLWGFLGIFLAVPVAVATMVLVKMLWIREALGEPTNVPGEEGGER